DNNYTKNYSDEILPEFSDYKHLPSNIKINGVSEASISTLSVDSNTQSTSNTISSQQAPSEIYEKLDFCRQKAIVTNTEKSTRNWVTKFEEFRKNYNYIMPLDKITNSELKSSLFCMQQHFHIKNNKSMELLQQMEIVYSIQLLLFCME
ncbi:4128_t:CDS:2, partial [Entrophospora sp. SA101]